MQMRRQAHSRIELNCIVCKKANQPNWIQLGSPHTHTTTYKNIQTICARFCRKNKPHSDSMRPRFRFTIETMDESSWFLYFICPFSALRCFHCWHSLRSHPCAHSCCTDKCFAWISKLCCLPKTKTRTETKPGCRLFQCRRETPQ